jgi:hypothetical protein
LQVLREGVIPFLGRHLFKCRRTAVQIKSDPLFKFTGLRNPVGFGQAFGKTGQKPGFSAKSKEAVPKTEVLEQPQIPLKNRLARQATGWSNSLPVPSKRTKAPCL